MIEVKDYFLKEVVDLYDFDRKHGQVVDEDAGQFTGGFGHQTIEVLGEKVTYYFSGAKLFGYEEVV